MTKSREYRMISLGLMNLVNRNENDMHVNEIKSAGVSMIDGMQMFITEKETTMLKIELYNRLQKIKVIV